MPDAGLYHEPPPLTAVRGTIAQAPASDAVGVYVTIPPWTQPWGPCVFSQKSHTLPAVGAACLVIFDDDRVPWVVMWVGQTTAFPDPD